MAEFYDITKRINRKYCFISSINTAVRAHLTQFVHYWFANETFSIFIWIIKRKLVINYCLTIVLAAGWFQCCFTFILDQEISITTKCYEFKKISKIYIMNWVWLNFLIYCSEWNSNNVKWYTADKFDMIFKVAHQWFILIKVSTKFVCYVQVFVFTESCPKDIKFVASDSILFVLPFCSSEEIL